MREPIPCLQVRRLLAFHGLPAARIERVTRELAGHWEDLRDGAREAGLSESAAAAQADERLGQPERLAAEVIAGLGRSSWLGRHPVLAVCVAPLFLQPVLMGAFALPLYWIGKLTGFEVDSTDARLTTGVFWSLYYVTLVLSLAWLCWRGWTSGLGARWVTAACSWSALAALVRFFDADPVRRQITFGFGFPWRLNGQTVLILILHVLAAAWFLFVARSAWTARRLKMVERVQKNRI